MERKHDMQRYLSRQEAMRIMGISKNTMTRVMKEPGFPAYKIAGVIRIGEDELEEWLRKQRLNK